MLAQYEAALSQAEATLAEDGLAFDRFLKESDEKVQQAMRKADAEMRLKQEKVCSLLGRLDLASPSRGRILAAFTAACLQTHLASGRKSM